MVHKKGMEVGNAIVTDVAYSPKLTFNLCSLPDS